MTPQTFTYNPAGNSQNVPLPSFNQIGSYLLAHCEDVSDIGDVDEVSSSFTRDIESSPLFNRWGPVRLDLSFTPTMETWYFAWEDTSYYFGFRSWFLNDGTQMIGIDIRDVENDFHRREVMVYYGRTITNKGSMLFAIIDAIRSRCSTQGPDWITGRSVQGDQEMWDDTNHDFGDLTEAEMTEYYQLAEMFAHLFNVINEFELPRVPSC